VGQASLGGDLLRQRLRLELLGRTQIYNDETSIFICFIY
jgi:hypothetical protein